MPTVRANNVTLYYEKQGSGEPLVLIPYLAADQACYAYQVAAYAKRFTCITVDPRGAGQSDKPNGTYTTELFADDIAAFMQAIGVERAHISGLSLGAAVAVWLGARHPARGERHFFLSAWAQKDPILRRGVMSWPGTGKG